MRVARRVLLGAGLAAATAAATGCGGRPATPRGATPAVPSAASTGASPPASATPAGPAVTPADLAFTPGRTLRPATGPPPYADRVLDRVRRYLAPTPEIPGHQGYPGAVVLVAVDGEVTVHAAVGEAVRYGAGPVLLPAAGRVPMRTDSIFDIASITKVFTALLVLREVDRGRVDVAAPVARYLPDFRGAGKADVTVGMLLAHTSGLPIGAGDDAREDPDQVSGRTTAAARRAAVLATPLLAGAVPGRVFRYSSVGLMVLAHLLETLDGRPLDDLVRTGLTGPLGLRDTGFRPTAWPARPDRLVATDARSSRGLLRGVVHDQVAHAAGGVAGHAGLFSTAADLAVVGQLLLNGGEYGGTRLLGEATVRRMLTNANVGLPAIDAERPGRSSTHGLGVELAQPWFMGRLAAPLTFGHTGFTGTELLVEPNRRLVLVLLTNRAHPNWSWAAPDPPRVAVADALAEALPGA
jgi:CubicO group peptidase (beta-lactamase class C family)